VPIHFGDFTLDDSRRQLLRGAEPLHLSPKAFQLLTILIAERPRAVSKKDLHDRLWPDTFVNEGNLANAVAEVRSVLGDDRRESRFIRTLYGFGYAFTGSTDAPQPARTSRPRRIAAIATVLFGVVALTTIFAFRRAAEPAPAHPRTRSLAVLPFDTSGVGPGDEHLGLGLPDLIITRLSNVHQLTVRPTSAIREFRGTDSREAGRKLKVDAVLEGSIRTTADRVRVTVQLLDVHDQKPIWAEQFDQNRAAIFAIEDSVSERVAEALTMRLTPGERNLLAKRYTNDPEAYELYMQGRYEQERLRREGKWDPRRSIDLFEKAAQKDPSYALAWAAAAQEYATLAGFNQLPPGPAFQKAKTAAQRAFQLDDGLSEAHTAAGTIKLYSDFDFAGAEREYLRALEINPRNAIAIMHYGHLLMNMGRFDEGIAMRKLQIDIDPLNPAYQSFLAGAYVKARRDDLAIQQCLLVLRMDPNFVEAQIDLARVYALRGEYDKAIEHAQHAVQLGTSHRRAVAHLGYVFGVAGRKEEANGILEQLEADPNVAASELAIVQMGLGHTDEVLQLLEKGFDDRTYVLPLKTEPIFEPVRSNPRFKSLLQRAGFGS